MLQYEELQPNLHTALAKSNFCTKWHTSLNEKYTHRLCYSSTKIVSIFFKLNFHIFSNLVFKLQKILQIQIADAHAIETFIYLDIFSFYYFSLIFHQTSQCNICIADIFALEGTKICSQKIANWKRKCWKNAEKIYRKEICKNNTSAGSCCTAGLTITPRQHHKQHLPLPNIDKRSASGFYPSLKCIYTHFVMSLPPWSGTSSGSVANDVFSPFFWSLLGLTQPCL